MKKLIIVFLALSSFLLHNCSENEGLYSNPTYYNESTIYSANNKADFREILCIINLTSDDGTGEKYVVSPQINEIVFTVNDNLWGKFSTSTIDTSTVNYYISGNLILSNQSINYPLVAKFIPENDTLTLAGEYANLLLDFSVIEPGTYLCRIESLKFTDANSDTISVYPHITIPFEVEDGAISTYIGTFNIPVNN
ncbi:MAG: hypothetical protein JXR58_06600 [Bacteroidales bacterium]|nr:hypothetical protein [Bacteroidales bacterium]